MTVDNKYYLDTNGNLINNINNNPSIIGMGQTVNIKDIGSWSTKDNNLGWGNQFTNWLGITNDPSQSWQFNFNDQLKGSFIKHTGFGNLNTAQQAEFQKYYANTYGADFSKNASPEQLQDVFNKWKGSNPELFETGNDSLFGWGKDKNGNTTLGGANGFQWAGAGVSTLQSLYGMYQGHKQMKLAKQAFDEQKRLSHANYQMQAKAYNNNLRNQQSGRSFGGMSGSAMRTLGSEYKTRRAKDDY